MGVATAERRARRPRRARGRAAAGRACRSSSRCSRPGCSSSPLVSIFPFVYIILMSLSRVGLIGGISLDWVGLDNWTRLFTDERRVGASWVRASSTSC